VSVRAIRPADRRRWLVVAALLCVAALLRIATLFYHELSGDDATVALMAKHILAGESFPAFFYRQTYMGSLNGFHLVPALFVAGPSVLLVRLNAVAYSLLFPLGLYLMGRRVFDEGTARVALWLAAVPPFLLTYWSGVAEPHFETNSFAVFLLLLGLAALRAEPGPRQTRVLAVFGLMSGLAWWTNYKALEVILPALLVLWVRDPRLPLRRAGAMLGGGFVLGSLPAWLFHAGHGDPPHQIGQGVFGTAVPLSLTRLADLLGTVALTILGGYYGPAETLARRAALAINVAFYAAGVGLLAAEAVRRLPSSSRCRSGTRVAGSCSWSW
jgi:hypothetical protein